MKGKALRGATKEETQQLMDFISKSCQAPRLDRIERLLKWLVIKNFDCSAWHRSGKPEDIFDLIRELPDISDILEEK